MQRFTAERPGLEGVEVQIATYARANRCHLEIALADADGRVLAQRTLDAADLRDNAAVALPCPPQSRSQGRDYVLRIQSADARSGDAVTLIVDVAARGGELRRGTNVVAGRLVFTARYAGDHGNVGELTAGVRAVQTFVAPQNGLQAVSVLLTDFGRKNAGTLHATLRDPLTGAELAQRDVPGADVANEYWLQLTFAPVNDSAGRHFAIELVSPDATAGHAVTALLEHHASYDGQLTVGGELRLGRLMLTMEQAPQRPSTAMLLRTVLLAAAGVALAAAAIAARARRRWHGRAITAALSLCLLAVVEGYLRNLRLLFYGAGFVFAVTLCLHGSRQHGRRRLIQVQFGMSSLLMMFALLGFEFAGDAAPAAAAADDGKGVTAAYSYDEARGNPAAFRAWWQQLTGEWHAQDRGCGPLQEPDPLGELPFLVRANSSSKFFASTITTNSLALRGPEVPKVKGDAFRILCVGESTTMGQTIRADDVPWPERLQALIGAQHRGRRVEVLNGGWAGYDLRHSVVRMRRFFLELQPDLVVVYHGINSFWMLLDDLPRAMVPKSRIPVLPQRPSRVLAAAEHALDVAAFRAELFGRADTVAGDPSTSACAASYRELLRLCREHGIAVALCDFNMAVVRDTPPAVVEFYREGFPQVGRLVAANELHTQLVQGLCRSEKVTFVEANTDLAGRYADSFVDLVHFTQRGREQMAVNVLAGIGRLLPP